MLKFILSRSVARGVPQPVKNIRAKIPRGSDVKIKNRKY